HERRNRVVRPRTPECGGAKRGGAGGIAMPGEDGFVVDGLVTQPLQFGDAFVERLVGKGTRGSDERNAIARSQGARLAPQSTEGPRPSASPTRVLQRRFAGALRSRGRLAPLARARSNPDPQHLSLAAIVRGLPID